jgi:short-chain fatty acids transporter
MQRIALFLKRALPSPFSIALVLTALTLVLALIFTDGDEKSPYAINLLLFWEDGLWNSNLLVFAFQMMLMLVLGHMLALSQPVDRLLQQLTQRITDGAQAAALVTFVAIVVGLFNWGLALIVGAVFARKVGEFALKRNMPINYPLIGAAGYTGLMVWHGGISGSSLVKVAEKGHIGSLVSSEFSLLVPLTIQFDQTVFSTMNSVVSLSLVLILPSLMYWLAKRTVPAPVQIKQKIDFSEDDISINRFQLDSSPWFVRIFGILLLVVVGYQLVDNGFLQFFTPNRINLLLLMLVFLMHRNAKSILHALEDAIQGASGILLQFPLYFGIMGIANQSGLLKLVSEGFVALASADSLPIFTFISAGIVNVFVPSGGGQWVVQGPVILDAAMQLDSNLSKNIMALAYGDQLTNMLQPFWALPLLGITGLKAQEILPYTLILLLAGATIFVSALLIF